MITWEAKKEQIFEMPTGGAAIMRKGPNLLKFARKEQCLALTTQLRTKFKLEPCFYRCERSSSSQTPMAVFTSEWASQGGFSKYLEGGGASFDAGFSQTARSSTSTPTTVFTLRRSTPAALASTRTCAALART